MISIFDEYGNLNIDDIIAEQPSFLKIMEDGIVEPHEVMEQAERVSILLREFEKSASEEQIELMRKILAELSVLVAVNGMKEN